jgi:hypothetical protein
MYSHSKDAQSASCTRLCRTAVPVIRTMGFLLLEWYAFSFDYQRESSFWL